MFCHNPGKNGWSNCHSYITSTLGLGGRKILGRFVWRRNVTVDVVNTWTLHWVDVQRVSKHYQDVPSVDVSSRHHNFDTFIDVYKKTNNICLETWSQKVCRSIKKTQAENLVLSSLSIIFQYFCSSWHVAIVSKVARRYEFFTKMLTLVIEFLIQDKKALVLQWQLSCRYYFLRTMPCTWRGHAHQGPA